MSILAALTGLQYLLTLAIILVCVLLILVILLQRGRGGGLTAAFGGSGGGSSAFGAKTGDVFTVITVVLASVYLLFNVIGNYSLLPPGESETPQLVSPAGTTGGEAGPGTDAVPAEQGATEGGEADAGGGDSDARSEASEPGADPQPASSDEGTP